MTKEKEVPVYTAESPAIAEMLIEKLENLDIPARLGNESSSAGVFAIPGQSRTIWVEEKLAQKAKDILEIK